MPQSNGFARGGFWRRALALSIDALVAAVVLELLAFALFPLTNGRLQATGGLTFLFCDTLATVPEGVSIPADLAAEPIKDCRGGLFGLISARMVKVKKVTQNGAVATTREFNALIDADGKAVSGPNLDLALLPLLFILRWLFDCVGGTLGRRICRVRLAVAADGRYPLTMRLVAQRYALQSLAIVPALVWTLLQGLLTGIVPANSMWLSLGLASTAALAVAIAVNAMIYRRDAWYDRFAAACVLRVDQNKAAIPIATVTPPPVAAASGLADSHVLATQAVAAVLGVAAPSPLTPPFPTPGSRNYVIRHWRGELSLPKSYWLNGCLGGLAVGFTVSALAHLVEHQGYAQPLLWMASLIATWGVVVLFATWQSVGVWRSATRYRRSGRTFWGGVAQAMTVLAILQCGYNFLVFGMAQIAELYEIVSEDTRVGPHQFQVLADGQVLEFSGGISFGVAKELDEFLSAMSNLKTVRLNSIGGRIYEAQKMSDMLRARGLSTLVTQDCLSACTIVFLGGKERLIASFGRLGFHQPTFRGTTASDRRAAISNEQVRLQRFGLSKSFAERANVATPNDMWYPDLTELLREKVVTRLVTPPPPAKAPGANATQVATVTIRPPPSTAAPIGTPSVLPVPGAPLQTETGTYQPGRATIPADLMQRLVAPPKKPVVMPPVATAGPAAAPAVGEQK